MEQVTIQDRFERFHRENPHVYRLFIKFAFELKAAGNAQGSASMIFERLRWEAKTKLTDQVRALNNNYRSRYARLAMDNHPELEGFFKTRRLAGERKPKKRRR